MSETISMGDLVGLDIGPNAGSDGAGSGLLDWMSDEGLLDWVSVELDCE